MTEARKPNPIKAAWRRFKDRLKLTWIGWFYICATKETIGNVLLAILLVGFFIGSFGFSSYMAVRHYTSWDELPCQTGRLVKAGEAGRGNSSSTLADEAGVRYKFYGTSLKPFIGQTLTVCYVTEVLVWPPFYSRELATIIYPDGTRRLHRRGATPTESAQYDILWMKVFWLWMVFPSFLWLLKRYARAAWRARQAHLDSLVSIHQNPGSFT